MTELPPTEPDVDVEGAPLPSEPTAPASPVPPPPADPPVPAAPMPEPTPRRSGRFKLLAAVVAAAVAVTAVVVIRSSGDDDENGGGGVATGGPPVTLKPVGAFSPELVDRLTGMLDDAGVAIVSDDEFFESGDASGGEGLVFSEFQVRSLAVEIADDSGGGFYGSQIDEIVALPADVPPMSYFLAGWVTTFDTPGAKAAADLMGERDWVNAPEVVFPSVVLALFVGDMVAHIDDGGEVDPGAGTTDEQSLRGTGTGEDTLTAQAAGAPVVVALPVQESEGPCSLVGNYVESVLSRVFDAVKPKESAGITGLLVKGWNAAVNLAKTALTTLVEILTAPIAGLLRTAIGIVGVISMASSMLRPWSVRVDADPDPNRYAIGDSEPKPTGTVTARINDNGFPGWPASMQDCATFLGFSLPSPDADVGSPVRWKSAGPGVNVLGKASRDDILPADKVAKLKYTVEGRESREDAERGKLVEDILSVQVGFERRAITQLKAFLKGVLLNLVPGVVRPVVNPLLSPVADSVLNSLSKYVEANGSTVLTIRHHTPVRCKLFTLAEANRTFKLSFDQIVTEGPTGCAAGKSGGTIFGYYYSAAYCALASSNILGVTFLPELGEGAFYHLGNDTHALGFPSVSNPNSCVIINASPISAFAGGDIVRFAGNMRQRS